MAYFAGYGFNRSHSVAYALIAYRTAYLKAHFPHEFMAALISSDLDNTDKVMRYIGDCRDMGITVLPPDINEGFHGFTVHGEQHSLWFRRHQRGGAQRHHGSWCKNARRNGVFQSFFDFCERIDFRHVNKKVMESLIKGGALDSLGLTRAHMLGNMARVLEWAQRQQEDRQQGQFSLFGGQSCRPVGDRTSPGVQCQRGTTPNS